MTRPAASPETVAYLGVGSNLGDRRANCKAALARLAAVPGVRLVAVSSWRETAPVGPVAQGPFINGAAAVATSLSPQEMLAACLAVEQALGRRRTVRWGPRSIDLDLLLYGDRVIRETGLTVPHPHLHARRFVLEPLVEIAPQAVHPGYGVTVSELLRRLDSAPAREAGGAP